MSKTLVLGASGFLGSHVTKTLFEDGRDVRVLVRQTSNTAAIDHLKLERFHGDVLDSASLKQAMQGCDSVFYCVVDTRAWLRDPAPLYRVNVDGLRNAMEAALRAGIKKFVFTSTFGTIGRREDGPSAETDAFNWWEDAPEYIRCRVVAENLFMEYCRDKGLPGVACCIGNTYGPDDVGLTPHGNLVKNVALGRMPLFWEGGGPSLGIKDAARGMILAEKNGRVGERYAFAERWLSFQEMFALAAHAAGVKPPKIKLPIAVLYGAAFISELVCRLVNRESQVTVSSIKCSRLLPDIDCSKAKTELGWTPDPIEQSIQQAVDYYLDHKPV
ncbi:MAG: NAD-dependent epimerase/dehydratase family protein [Gammaproteobacteria bacterium]|nr:NAD-dependent epimerase/dehydratase family protein [Gammaproteobacteria bacterium]